MPIDPLDLRTGGALLGAVADSLIASRERAAGLTEGDLIGPYRVLGELGRGGMAIVYRAERADGEYEQQVALKWMQVASADARGEALFRRERQALADLRHPHIATLLDGGRSSDGRPWFAMELIDGQPLDQHAVDAGLSVRERLQLFLPVCAAVAFAHARGIIHRDIKPTNVLVDREGGAKLLDFGIAQLLNEADSLASRAYTPGFASPEQMRGGKLTVASDVYQLGRLLASLLSEDRGEQQRLTELCATRLPATGEVDAAADHIALPRRIDGELSAIIRKACATQPEQRYATAEALAADVLCALHQRPLAAKPRRALYIAERFVRRHPFGVAAAAVVLLSTLAASISVTARLKQERDAANHEARVAQTVISFMRDDLLAAADPAASLGQELSVREALDRASESASARFAELPAEHSAIRVTLASLYDELGRRDEALANARQAVTLAERAGLSVAQGFDSRLMLASILINADQLDAAETVLDGVAAAAVAAFAPGSRELLRIDNMRGVLLHRHGQFEPAQALQEAVLQQATESLGSNDALARAAAEQLALNLQMRGQHDAAMPLLLRALRSTRDALGERHPRALQVAHSVGVLQRHLGQFEDAYATLSQVLAARRDVLGDKHPETIGSINELATVLQEQKRYADAERLFREVLEVRRQQLGEEHIYTRNSMSNLGLLYALAGRPDDAAPLYEEALNIETRLIGESHPDTLALMHNIAGLYRKQGRIPDALAMHARVIGGAEASANLGPDAWQTGFFRIGRAQTLQAGGQLDAAIAEFALAVAVIEGAFGSEHARTLRAREMQAAAVALRDASRAG